MRRARRTDVNQREIVLALRAAGRFVEILSDVGRGVPDLLVSWSGRCLLVEVKVPGARLTPLEADWHRRWKGPPVAVVHSVAEALLATGIRPPRAAPSAPSPSPACSALRTA